MLSYTDYLMIISPPQEIKHEIDRFKRASARQIGEFSSLHSKAHISINKQMRCKPFHAQPAIKRMAKPLSTLPPINLKIDGFRYFAAADKYTIYAALVNDAAHENWFRELRSHMRLMQKTFVPHITVARALHPHAFNHLWPFFEGRDFKASFMADRLTILERETFVVQSNWKPFIELPFGANLLTAPGKVSSWR